MFVGLKTSTMLNKDSEVGTLEFIQRHREKSSNGKYVLKNKHSDKLYLVFHDLKL